MEASLSRLRPGPNRLCPTERAEHGKVPFLSPFDVNQFYGLINLLYVFLEWFKSGGELTQFRANGVEGVDGLER